MTAVSRLLTHPVTKWLFLVGSVIAAIGVLVAYWPEVGAALGDLPTTNILLAGLASMAYVLSTMASWRAILADLGSPLTVLSGSKLFFVSQLGKYIPGGVWNVVAVSEMGKEYSVPRRTALGSMLVFWLVSVTTGLLVGGLYVAAVQAPVPGGGDLWMAVGLIVGVVLLSPPVLRRVLHLGLRILRRPSLPREPTAGGLLRAVGWALVGWLAAGLQVWLIASPMSPVGVTVQSAIGAYALAWTAGFLVVVAPAGAGIREGVLAALLAGSLGAGAVVTLVLLSRFWITLADVLLAGCFLGVGRGRGARASLAIQRIEKPRGP